MADQRFTGGARGAGGALRRRCGWVCSLALWAAGCGNAPQVIWRLHDTAVEPTAPLFTDAGVVFGHARGVSIVGRDGRVVCHFPEAGRVVATPRTDGRRFFFGGSNHLFYAIDDACQPVWRQVMGAPVDHAPEVVGDAVFVGGHDGYLQGLDAATGAVRWTFPARPTVSPAMAPAPAPQAVARAEAHAEPPPRRRGRAARHRVGTVTIAAAMPEVAPEVDAADEVVPAGGFGGATPVAVGGVVYAVCDDHYLYGVEALSGAFVGRHDLGARAIGPPIMMNGLVVVATDAGHVRAVDRETLRLAWSTELTAQPGSVPHLLRSAIAFFTADQRLVGLDPTEGKERWQSPTAQLAGGSAEFFGPWTLTWAPGPHAGIVAADNVSGKVVWRLPTRGDAPSHVAREGRRLWVLAGDGQITCLQLPALRA